MGRQVTDKGLSARIGIPVLQAALVLGVIAPFWWQLWRLPPGRSTGVEPAAAETLLTVRVRIGVTDRATLQNLPVELYPIDVSSVYDEFAEKHPHGVSFQDFLQRKLNGGETIKIKLDETGGAALMVPQGRWWLYATMGGPVSVQWRLPLNVSGRRQSVDLTTANEYMRSESF
jgi:hypothetical protein